LQCAGDLARNKYTLLTCEMIALRGRKVCAEEYARLSPAGELVYANFTKTLTELDRVRLLNKVLNDIRKRALLPVTGQYPIVDARCPLVRFVYNR
uniref:SAM-dependent methyltransferase n=1 Tax=Gongylonema pulchrum TaxID=637853 RepID=A0A183DFW6_9BILA